MGYSDGGILHLHGALVVRGVVAVLPNDFERIHAALEAAGGTWASNRGDHHQLVIRTMYDPDGWAVYLNRNRAEAATVTDGPLWSMTNAARREAKALYDDLRKRINAAWRGKEDSMTTTPWAGLSDDEKQRLATDYDSMTERLAMAAYQEHPDDETAAARRMVELKVGLARAMVDAVKRLGCPDDLATETVADVIAHVVENRRALAAVVVTVH
jgi:hypothetical protein